MPGAILLRNATAIATLQARFKSSVGHQRKQVRPVWERLPTARFTNAVSLS
ncbi:hypothetical protein [Okeania sp. SIO2B3]|uniref:hypothetical protein n=1 Tax=Okeania sp. SIO2B3 TaxID=2607784 RepID=UPI0013C09996|nr:hypothetical protein [Okeania sp. SIO2B3]NET46344.1 hypothetical protein [Okeania sp. SIO2B3]